MPWTDFEKKKAFRRSPQNLYRKHSGRITTKYIGYILNHYFHTTSSYLTGSSLLPKSSEVKISFVRIQCDLRGRTVVCCCCFCCRCFCYCCFPLIYIVISLKVMQFIKIESIRIFVSLWEWKFTFIASEFFREFLKTFCFLRDSLKKKIQKRENIVLHKEYSFSSTSEIFRWI